MWVRHILRPGAAEKTAWIILSLSTELNGSECSYSPIVTCTQSLCSADLDHMAGPCERAIFMVAVFLFRVYRNTQGWGGTIGQTSLLWNQAQSFSWLIQTWLLALLIEVFVLNMNLSLCGVESWFKNRTELKLQTSTASDLSVCLH